MAAAPVIETADLSVGYGEAPVLRHVDLVVRAGEIVTIIGGSGCGKSTLLKTILGLLPPLGGRMQLFGKALHELGEAERTALMTRIGMLFQGGALLNSLPVADNVALPLVEHTGLPRDVVGEIVTTKLAQVGLGHAGPLYPDQLSGGMRKRAALARAMALDPEILFCDEPSAGLDPVTAAGIDTLLLQLRDTFNVTVVVVTHELESIKTIADHVVMLGGGRRLFDGPLAAALESPITEVREFFGRKRLAPGAPRGPNTGGTA